MIPLSGVLRDILNGMLSIICFCTIISVLYFFNSHNNTTVFTHFVNGGNYND